jgi:hypothetical protein
MHRRSSVIHDAVALELNGCAVVVAGLETGRFISF